ncbi:MAG: Wzz/FepE/Etk N-terminal domain-containing protein [Actinomycetota bacterium]|nr:Wzz/FepE/Etk N-terminal domain-containing protein [Actinomycetota bacterium]
MREDFPLELRQYLEILRRHKWFVLEAVVLVGLTAGILSNLRTPVYRAAARVLLTPNDPTQQLNPLPGNGALGNDPDRYVAGQINIVKSEGVAAEAVKSLPGVSVREVESKLSVTQDGESNVLKISATDPDPARARDIAQAAAKGYIENRRQAAVSGLEKAAKDIQDKLEPLQAQIAMLDTQIAAGPAAPGVTSVLTAPERPAAAAGPTPPAPQVSAPAANPGGVPSTQEALKAARYAAAVQYETLYARQQELVVDISLKRGDAELIADAKMPDEPISPHPGRDAALGALVGLLLGVGVSVLREQLNDKIRSANEVEGLTGLPLLAQLPFDDRAIDGVAVEKRPNSPFGEAMRSLRTSIQYQGVDRPVKVLLVTSSLPGEGKSLVAANLAAAFAQAEYRTLLISADLRRPTVDGLFGELPPSVGLIGVISPVAGGGKAPTSDGHGNGSGPESIEKATLKALQATPISGLLLLPSGPTPPNPAELLGSRRMATILNHLSMNADVIIIDSPPLLPVTDAAVLAAKCEGVVLVAGANETPRGALERAKMILDGTGARVLGVVFNKSRKATGGYYYGGYYGNAPEAMRRRETSPSVGR